MGRFSVIPQESFDEFQVDAGVLLRSFDPQNPKLIDEDIICATTGGINPTCVPTSVNTAPKTDTIFPEMPKSRFSRIAQTEECAILTMYGYMAVNTAKLIYCFIIY